MYRVSPEVPGGFGESTVLDATVHPPLVTRLHMVFQDWMGDDLVESFPCYLVSDRLRNAFEAAGLSGLEFADVEVEVDAQANHFFPDLVERLPKWWWIQPVRERGSDFWQDEVAQLFVSARALEVLQRYSVGSAEMMWIET